jgi:hypothetical protein
MMNRVWKFGIAALGGILAACSGEGGDKLSGSSLETENSIALSVQLADGTPAARVQVFIRPDSYLASGDSLADSLANENMNFETNDSGSLTLTNLGYGSYIVEARSDSLKGASKFNYRSWHAGDGRVSLHVGPPGAVAGQVLLEENVDAPVTVAVQGLDYSTSTDSEGNFEFESLPAGNFEVVAFIQDDSTVVNEKGKKQHVSFVRKLGSVLAEVKAGQFRESLIDARPPVLSFVLEDFENGVDNWKIDHSKDASGKIESADAGFGREGKAAHFTCTNDSLYQWVLMGYQLGGFVDMSGLDSIVFWARAEANEDTTKRTYVSFSFDMNLDNTSEEESGKAWMHIDVDTAWKRYVVVPSELQEPDSNKTGGNLGWDVVKRRITDISIFGGTGGEFWIDDIEVFGYSEFVAKKPED